MASNERIFLNSSVDIDDNTNNLIEIQKEGINKVHKSNMQIQFKEPLVFNGGVPNNQDILDIKVYTGL